MIVKFVSCRSQLLPNHSSMELDLEIELSGPISLNSAADLSISSINSFYDLANNTSGAATLKQALGSNLDLYKTTPKADPLMTASTDSAIVTSMTSSAMTISSISSKDMTNSFTIAANMTGSTDSAIYSAPGSRSATASPLQAMFSETTLRYASSNKRYKHSSLVPTLPSRPVSLQISLHDQAHKPELLNGLSALSNYNMQHQPNQFDPSMYPFYNYSLDSPLNFIHKDHVENKVGSEIAFDSLLSEFPPAFTGSTTSCDSGVSSQRASNSFQCGQCRRSLVESDNASSERDSVKPVGKKECRPCEQCTSVLKTVAAVQDMYCSSHLQPCQNFEPTTLNRVSSDVNVTDQAKNIRRNTSLCRDSGCDFTTL